MRKLLVHSSRAVAIATHLTSAYEMKNLFLKILAVFIQIMIDM